MFENAIFFDSNRYIDIVEFLLEHQRLIKLIYINQPAGLGDILYTLELGRIFAGLGFRIPWPVIEQYSWLGKNFPDPRITIGAQANANAELGDIDVTIKSLSSSGQSEACILKGICYIPLTLSLHNSEGSKSTHQKSKYAMLGLEDYAYKWSQFLMPSLDFAKSTQVHQALTCGRNNYIFCNNMIGSPNGHQKIVPHAIPFHRKNSFIIWNQYIPEVTPFDWYLVLQNALEIHTPDTSLIYIIEILKALKIVSAKRTKLFMYQREGLNPSLDDFRYLSSVVNFDDWTFIKNNEPYSVSM